MIKKFASTLKDLGSRYLFNRFGVSILVLAVSFLLTVMSSVSFHNASVTDKKGNTNSFIMPLAQDNAPVQNFRIRFEMDHFSFLQDYFKIIPDNRVNSILINGTKVDLTSIPKPRLEDWVNGFSINLGKYLRFGRNSFEVDIDNLAGAFGFIMQSKMAEFFTILDLFILICVMILVLMRKDLGFNKVKMEQTVAVLSVSLLAFVIRYYLLPYQSGDYSSYLAWFQEIKQQGFQAYRLGTSNYAPLYLYLLGLTTLLPVAAVEAIKSLPIFFDFLTAVFAYKIVSRFYPKKPLMPLFAFFSMLFLPTVWMNSALWGQCDSIFMSFIVISVYMLLTNRVFYSLLFYGVALSFKVQAVFIIPLYFVFFLLGKIRLRYLFLVPGVYLVTIIPAWIAGRPLMDLLLIYARQSSTFTQLTLNAPTFYQWVGNVGYLIYAGIAMTFSFILALSYIFWKGMKGRPVKNEKYFEIALLFCLVVPFFLPTMHERYFYLVDVMALIYAFINPRRFYLALVAVLVSLFSYGPFLFGVNPIPLQYVSLAVAFMITLVLSDLVRDMFPRDGGRKLTVKK